LLLILVHTIYGAAAAAASFFFFRLFVKVWKSADFAL